LEHALTLALSPRERGGCAQRRGELDGQQFHSLLFGVFQAGRRRILRAFDSYPADGKTLVAGLVAGFDPRQVFASDGRRVVGPAQAGRRGKAAR